MATADTTPKSAQIPASTPVSGVPPKAPTAPRPRASNRKGWTVLAVLLGILVLCGAGGWYWWQQHLNALPPYIALANGRLEAEQVEIAAKYPGRIAAVLAKEGDMVEAGTVVARMDTVELEAQLRAAKAQVDKAQHEKAMAGAQIVQRASDRLFAAQELERTTVLVQKGWATFEELDKRRSLIKDAQAAYDTAVAAENAATATIDAGQAEVARLQSQINDSTLIAPVGGRIQYKLAQPGEVLQSGGRVLTLLDLTDVYMTIFVPARVAGFLGVGDEARVTLDPLAGYVFPAHVTFVATEAQFTPKTVETAEEREKLMFRVKLSINPELRSRYQSEVKTGVRGLGFVRTEKNATWPDRLNVKLP
jgi:HlyD family secretion protein